MPEIKDKIKELRLQHKVSKTKLAKYIGCSSYSTIAHWENGTCEPSMYYLIKLADFFNVSLDELCCRNFKGEK